ncbi:MAG: methyltransferase domain-containing protein [Hyphomicrobium sp.]
MQLDAAILRDFYRTPLGQVVRRQLASHIRKRWKTTSGLTVIGTGFATPYLGSFRSEAMRTGCLMPARQGALVWPPGPRCHSVLVEEHHWPLPDNSVDRLLAVHMLEAAERVGPVLREMWRVLAPDGRLILIVPNRSGVWSRIDTTPFGYGLPFSRSQLAMQLGDALLQERSRVAVRRRWWNFKRWRTPHAEVSSVDALVPGAAQVVWANMMLHAEPDPPALVRRWHELLSIDGFVMFSCLGPGTLVELRALYGRLGWPNPAAAFVDMHDLGDMLVHAGFSDPVLDQETLTLHWPDATALLAELRTLGANAAPDRHAGLRTPRWRDRLVRELATLAGPDGRLRLSFEVVYGHAFKAAPRARAGEPTSISLHDMRTMVRAHRPGPG